MAPVTTLRILVAGEPFPALTALLARLATRGFGSHSAPTLRHARELLRTFKFDVVLAAENLPGGRGYDLGELILRQSGTLFVAVPLSETCLWLPVVEAGANVFGTCALNTRTLELQLGLLLVGHATAEKKPSLKTAPLADARARSARNAAPRRKNRGGDALA